MFGVLLLILCVLVFLVGNSYGFIDCVLVDRLVNRVMVCGVFCVSCLVRLCCIVLLIRMYVCREGFMISVW